MVRVFVFLAAVQLVLVVLALISSLSADRVRSMPRAAWILVILLIPLVGPLAYFLWGRPLPAPREGSLRRPPARPLSPDDDPDFLRSVDTEQSRRDRELLAQWERDLDEGRRGQPGADRAADEGTRNPADGTRNPADGTRNPADGKREVNDGTRDRTDGKREVDEGKREPGEA